MSIKFVCDGCGVNANPVQEVIAPQAVQRKGGVGKATAFVKYPPTWYSTVGVNGKLYHACSVERVKISDARSAQGRI